MIGDDILSKIQKVEYRYGDSSVPPQHHRSYSITIERKAIRVVVDSYGEVLNAQSFILVGNEFEEVKKMIKKNKVGNCNLGEDEDCTGGTSESLMLYSNNEELFTGTVYHCGGKDSGDLCGKIDSLAEGIKNFIPGLRDMLK